MTLCSNDVFDLVLTLQSFQQQGLGLADCSRWLYSDVFNKMDSNHFLVVFLSYNRKQCDGGKNHFNDKVEKHLLHNTHVGTRGVINYQSAPTTRISTLSGACKHSGSSHTYSFVTDHAIKC